MGTVLQDPPSALEVRFPWHILITFDVQEILCSNDGKMMGSFLGEYEDTPLSSSVI